MPIIDKEGIIADITNMSKVVVELGCGNRKSVPQAIGVDLLDYDCVDIVGDVFDVLRHFPDASIDEVYSCHFVEHIADLPALMHELSRVQRPGGKLEIVVPHFSSPYFYSDYTHKTFFGLYTLSYFARDSIFKRRVPTYGKNIEYNLKSVNYVFLSPQPFYLRYLIKKVVGFLVNLNRFTKEFYEENLCYLFPCYEIKYQLIKQRHD